MPFIIDGIDCFLSLELAVHAFGAVYTIFLAEIAVLVQNIQMNDSFSFWVHSPMHLLNKFGCYKCLKVCFIAGMTASNIEFIY